ncbi:NOT2 / NOT3 / NOT5 family [Actinidia rufa]|uniref:NOT2 / NOT3 / NOT5 family n=1 Tax=Actinidia rufa TaxID=165716 RepID=A0A7J0DBS9_9ERIC|nr:NOT2 / NOT3 / NOT5 family [Actinidia rufa]
MDRHQIFKTVVGGLFPHLSLLNLVRPPLFFIIRVPSIGTLQGLHNIHGSFNVPNMPGTLASRSSTINNVPSSGVQQPTGSLSSGRFASNNLPVGLSQMSHGSSHGHSGVTNRAAIGNRSAVPGLGVSQILGNAGPRITSSVGNIVGVGNIGRNMSSGGGLSVPGLASRLNLTANSGSGNLNVQGPNRLMSGVLQQGIQDSLCSGGGSKRSALSCRNLAKWWRISLRTANRRFFLGSLSETRPDLVGNALPIVNRRRGLWLCEICLETDLTRLDSTPMRVISMLGNSYPSAGGQLSQSHVQAVNNLSSMGMLNDVNSNDGSPFDINDFPQLSSRPNSAGGPQGQLGGNADYAMDLHQKEQLHDNAVSMMQSQHFSMGRSAGFNLGGTYSLHRPQQQQQHAPSVSSSGISFSAVNNQDLLHLHGSDMFQSPHSSYHSQTSGPPGIGLRPMNSPNTGMGSYDQLMQQYQQHQTQSQFRLQQMSGLNQSYRDQGVKSLQATQTAPDPFGLLGLLSVIRMSDPALTSLALGIDLTTLGLNLNSAENLHKTFGSPWSDEPAKGDPEFSVPQCYYTKSPPALTESAFGKFPLDTLFYIFYSMPKDEAQLYAANELYNRAWFYHREVRLWFTRVSNMEPLVKTNTYERGSYICFDPNTWETIRKENFVVHYEQLEKRPVLPQH